MKNYCLFIFLIFVLFTHLYANEDLLKEHENIIQQHGDIAFLSGQHYFVQTFGEDGNEIVSVFTTKEGFCLYRSPSKYIVCKVIYYDNTLILSVKNIAAGESLQVVEYTTKISTDLTSTLEITMNSSSMDITTKELTDYVLPHSNSLFDFVSKLRNYDLPSFLEIIDSVQKIYEQIFVPNKPMELANKTTKQWKMSKSSSGDDSIFIDLGKSKILDFSVVITEKSEGVLVARVGAKVINNSILKIYPMQITHYGKTYWLKGNAIIIYE